MAENDVNQPPDTTRRIRDLANRPESRKPSDVPDKLWRRARLDAGHMVMIRSHFKSIFLIPMALISLVCAMAVAFGDGTDSTWQRTWGLIWAFFFMFYMNIFIFEWNRAWTVVLMALIAMFVAIGFAIDSDSFPVWRKLFGFFADLKLGLTKQTYIFFTLFFGFASMVSWIKTRLNYVIIEHNEMQVYRNAFFGDRERLSMLSPRIEVIVSDMIEYFHPFYRAGTVVIHAPEKTIVLENVLHIRRIERLTDKLGSTLQVRLERESKESSDGRPSATPLG